MKKVLKMFCLFGLILWQGCSTEETILTTDSVFSIRTLDIDNNQNASDFLVIFKLNNSTTIKEIRAFLIKQPEFAAFTSVKAANLPSESFHKIAVNGTDYETNLPASLKDVDGNDIEQGEDYFIAFALLIGDDVLLNTQIAEAKLNTSHYLTGKYIGSWDDNIYTGFGISADLTFTGITLSGPFWYSSNYTSCCGGQNDGRIILKLADNQITSFIYNQNLVSFMGGVCNGKYDGDGQIENFTTLAVNFTGNDCEGPHTGGRIKLTKVQ